MEGVLVRPMRESDLGYITSSWLQNYKNESNFAKRLTHKVYYTFHEEIIHRILSKKNSVVLIACDEQDPDVIYGYMVGESYPDFPLVHFILVKRPFRRMGIARAMIRESGFHVERAVFTHFTHEADDLLRKFPEMTYNPYRL